jgi:hypothetical protein
MKFATQILLSILLLIAGAALWAAGNAQRQLASAERTFVTLRHERAITEFEAVASGGLLRFLPEMLGGGGALARERLNAAQYWLGDYGAFTDSEDESLHRLAADASYRAARREGGAVQQVASRLDDAVKRYADILRADPNNIDAAYNFEFVQRMRASVMASRQKIPAGDLPASQLTIHGITGGPPADSDTKKFRMIVPMRPEERLEAEEAGRAGQRIRKG